MAHIVKLTVADRNNILKYAYNLPSTLGTYFNFDTFADIVGFSEEEEKELGIKYVDGEIQCNCPERTFDIDVETIPEPIMDAIRTSADQRATGLSFRNLYTFSAMSFYFSS